MNTKNIADIYPLSPMQQGMLFHSLYAPETGMYFEQTSWTLQGDLDTAAFAAAWQRILNRHTALRTGFLWEDLDEPLQVVYRQLDLPLETMDWRELDAAAQETRLHDFLAAERERGFDLAAAPLMRLTLIRRAEDLYEFVWSHHHLLLDGWSQPIVFGELFALYRALSQGEGIVLPPARPFGEYIAWLQQQDMDAAEAFWRQQLHGFAAPTPLVVDKMMPADDSQDGESFTTYQGLLPADLSQAAQSLVQQHQLTLNTLIQGAWALLLSRYSNEKDVLFGATVSGRPPELMGVEGMVGLFINTLPVRAQVQPDMPVLAWLQTLQARQNELRRYEFSPLVDVQGWSEVPRDQPLFESLLVFESYPVEDVAQESGQEAAFSIKEREAFARTNYPLTVAVSPGSQIGLEIVYDDGRFTPDTITRMVGHLQTLLHGIITDLQQPVADLPLLTAAERQQVVVDWNQTRAEFPADLCYHQLFAQQVAETPDTPALEMNGRQLTYRELDQRANQLAHYLQRRGVGPDVIVGVCVERSPEMIVAMLGVMKAGGAYVPADPIYPPDRIAYMLSDSGAPLLLTQESLLDYLPELPIPTICLDTSWDEIAAEETAAPANEAAPENLAYVIYTSGSTGMPKGALLRHRGLVNLVWQAINAIGLQPGTKAAQHLTSSFDASVAENFTTLASGATLCLIPQEIVMDPPELYRYLAAREVTHMLTTPSLLDAIPEADLPALQVIGVGGEALTTSVVARWASGRRFMNVYGPTEATVMTAVYELQEQDYGRTSYPIGPPLPNTTAYVLDEQLRPLPVGVPGELHVGGVCVARGYLNRPELTAAKFIPDPFSDDPDARLYKTGDLARWLPDGNLDFLGRIDYQVKIRGFRVELGEIEAALEQVPTVQQTAVILHNDDGNQQLVAYLVPADGVEPDVAELRALLKQRLPDYMVPAVYVPLGEMPLTASGKINRRALPAPDGALLALDDYVPPRTAQEEIIAGIWSQVLGIERVGVHDSFFELGGHSLLATQLVSRVRETLDVELPLRRLFEAPTVADMAAAINEASGRFLPPIEPVSREQDLPLSFAQQRLWFLDQLEPGNLFYNIPLAIRLTGDLDTEALSRALNEIVRRHEALRTTFVEMNGRPVQTIASELHIPLPITDLRDLPPNERETEVRRLATAEVRSPFDLAAGPLLRASLIRVADNEHVATLVMHHIVSDGWSMGVFIRELAALYQAFRQERPSPLPDLPIQYADFAHWQREWLQGDTLDAQLSYWKEQLADAPTMLDLPTDRPRPAVQSWHGSTFDFTLPADLSAAVKELSQDEGVTLFMLLLAAFQTLLHRYSGETHISVGSPIANRTRAEIEGLIGFFVNTLVMHTDLGGDPAFVDLLARVREVALGAYAHQDLPFETLVEALQPGRDLSHTPLFQVMFVLDNAPLGAMELPGLTLSPVEADSGTATFDLTLSMSEGPQGLSGSLEYNTDLFDRETIARMAGHFEALLHGIVADPEQRISQLPLLTADERQQILYDWNETAVPFPDDTCIHHLFEQRVAEQPDAVAVIFEDKQLTYAELDRRANQLAHYLQKLWIGPEVLVGLFTERSLEMVIGILGVLKAGGAYVPIDPTYPPERIAYMISDSQVPVLLTQAHLTERLPHHQAQVVRLDVDKEIIDREEDSIPESMTTAENLAYVIYTSGSTGKPKGTMLRHRGLCNLTDVQRRAFGVQKGSRVLQFSPLSFDASVWETFMALRNGATLVLAPQETLASGLALLRLLRDKKVTNVTLPPSVLAVLPPEELPDLKTIIAAGEACSAELVGKWAPERNFFNAYGPTETTVCASMHLCDEDDPLPPPIGRPISNFKLYILDQNLQPVPAGIPGELHVGAVSLARGYLNRPDLTAEKFIADPFSTDPDSRLYKTGDLVRYRRDGNIEFLGRVDHQVKVRGFRIELGEIEAVLEQYPDLQAAAVLAREDTPGDKHLVGYVTPAPEAEFELNNVRRFLREKLPEYMVPPLIVVLDEMPLTPSNKIDRKALPAPERSREALVQEYVAPRNETEEQLATICAELLDLEQVGVHDNFFDLGGHSLLATQFMSRVRDAFQVEIPLRTLFAGPTVADVAEAVMQAQIQGGAAQTQAPAITRRSRSDRRVKRSELGGNGRSQTDQSSNARNPR